MSFQVVITVVNMLMTTVLMCIAILIILVVALSSHNLHFVFSP